MKPLIKKNCEVCNRVFYNKSRPGVNNKGFIAIRKHPLAKTCSRECTKIRIRGRPQWKKIHLNISETKLNSKS